ncbi:MAG: cytochrome P450 [Thermoanaerobaculia bacterium]|nr:cytochrome P450 [Thermoanaerobaculia bacterium]
MNSPDAASATPAEHARTATRAPDPPGPEGAFHFGSLAEIRDNPMDFYVRISQKYGGIVRFFYGKKATYLVSEPDLIKELLIKHRERYVKNERYKELQRLIGEGLLLSEGEVWQRQRTSSMPAFRRERIHAQLPVIAQLVDERLDKWQAMVDSGEPFDTEPHFSEISQSLICDFILGTENRDLTEPILEVLRRLMTYWPTPPRTILGGYKLPSPKTVRELKGALADLDDCFYEAIRRARASNQEDGALGVLLQHEHESQGRYEDQELRDQLVTLYMAGFETSASVATWLFYRLSLQPQIRDRVYAEVASVLDGSPPDAETLPLLDLTKRSIQETMRLYPPAYNFSRIAVQDDVLGGYHIPKGAMVIVAPWATHRLTAYWPDPEGFDPDRFLPERNAKRPGMAYIPFGAGHRVCIGAGLATVQLTVTVARFCQRYRLDLEPAHHVRHVPGTVMRPENGMVMRVLSI